MAKKRRPSWRKVKRHYSYTVHDAARTLGCHRNTVRRWLKDGLPAVTDQKPRLILGDDLIAFLKARTKPKWRCRPNECFCLKCREPRRMFGGMADLIDPTPTGGNLRALCEVCETEMHKRVSLRQLEALKGTLDLREPAGGARAGDTGRMDAGGNHGAAAATAATDPAETIRTAGGASQPQCGCPSTERQTHLKDCPEPRLNDHLLEAQKPNA